MRVIFVSACSGNNLGKTLGNERFLKSRLLAAGRGDSSPVLQGMLPDSQREGNSVWHNKTDIAQAEAQEADVRREPLPELDAENIARNASCAPPGAARIRERSVGCAFLFG